MNPDWVESSVTPPQIASENSWAKDWSEGLFAWSEAEDSQFGGSVG